MSNMRQEKTIFRGFWKTTNKIFDKHFYLIDSKMSINVNIKKVGVEVYKMYRL